MSAAGAIAVSAAFDPRGTAVAMDRGPTLTVDPFTLGVASGDPASRSVVLWTRLAPDPLAGGGLDPTLYPVNWVVATDEALGNVVASGVATAFPSLGHSVHVTVNGLVPNTWYWYRFELDGYASPVGRTRTLPAWGTVPSSFRLAQVSCQRYTEGEFVVYDDMSSHPIDLVVHLGDYVYETHFSGQVRETSVPEPLDLVGYRNLHALYKSDRRLQAAHARCPWVYSWDDHEVENNYHADTPQPVNNETPTTEAFLARRAAAYQAWWEHSPVRAGPLVGPDLQMHRHFRIGDLASLSMLDTRQYRTPNPCDLTLHFGPRCPASFDPATTMLGFPQEAWLEQHLDQSPCVWDVIATVNVFHQWRLGSGQFGTEQWLHDSWDGYPAARQRLLDDIVLAGGDVVLLSGDVHSGWTAHVPASFDEPGAPTVCTEFVGPAATSKPQLVEFQDAIMGLNEHIQWGAGDQIGWVLHLISPTWFGSLFRVAPYPATTNSTFANGSLWINVPGLGGAVQWA